MHREPKQFVASVKKQYPEFFTGKKVLEVGSLDINGSVRPFFTDCDYTGIDLGSGPGVDEVRHMREVAIYNLYDVVISTEALEHDEHWNASLRAMHASLKPGGLLVITCAAPNRPEHGTARTGSAEASPFTSDYYRNISIEDFASVLPASLFSKSYLGYRGNMDDLYFAGIKSASLTSAIRNRYDVYIQENLLQAASLTATAVEFSSLLKITVTAEISTKDRYATTLPLTISAILTQTRKPDRLVIYDDGEQRDLRTFSPFDGLLRLADHLGIQWTFFTTNREGQVKNHQHALDNATTDLILRCDDDCILEPDCLENLLVEMTEGVGAVAPLIHHPCGVSPLPDTVDGSLNDVTLGVNMQWFDLNGSGPREVSHLNNSFLYRVIAGRKAGGYPRNLSVVGHREETMFSHSIKRAGYLLKIVPTAKAYHLRESAGGIRSFSDTSLWEHDEQIFQEYLKSIGKVSRETKLIVADMGIGDTLCLRGIWDDIRRKNPDTKYTIAICWPEVFEGVDDVTLISIAEAKTIAGDRYPEYSLYQHAWDHGKTNQPLPKTMMEFWG